MRIVFVRHGEPDYARDCLTDEGRAQAEAAAERLAGEGVSEIYASPSGRAAQTAACAAARLGLPVTTLDYMREISWSNPMLPHSGRFWKLSDRMLEEGFDFRGQDWREHPFFRGQPATKRCGEIAALFDEFLAGHGYRREGRLFLCAGGADRTVALFSHAGSGACVLAHLLSLPFPYVVATMPFGFASLVIVELPVMEGAHVFPRLELFNDCAHIRRPAGGPAEIGASGRKKN